MSGQVGGKIGLLLCRVVVPLWVLTGAMFKLIQTSPRTLPKETILNIADHLGIHLYGLLATLIGLEFLAVAVMVFLRRFARAMAMFMLTSFCLILLGELVGGNFTDCGCLGANSPPPWVMLMIDATLLAGVVLFKPTPLAPTTTAARWPIAMALVVILAGFATSFAVVIPAGQAPDHTPVLENGSAKPDASTPLPGYWFASDLETWIGKPWREVDLFTYMRTLPRDIDSAKRYVVFYSRTCDHCEEMFLYDLTDPALGSMVTAVEVPQSKTQLTSDSAWDLPATECEMLALPVGCDWIMTTPLTVTVEKGIITCATEGDHRQCMGLDE